MEVKIGSKGRITLPVKVRVLLGIKEGDLLTVEFSGRGLLLKPKAPSAEELWGVAEVEKVELEEVEESIGREL